VLSKSKVTNGQQMMIIQDKNSMNKPMFALLPISSDEKRCFILLTIEPQK